MLSNAGVPGRAVIREFASQPTPPLERLLLPRCTTARASPSDTCPSLAAPGARRRRHRRPHVVWGRRVRAQRADGALVGAQVAAAADSAAGAAAEARVTGPEHVQRDAVARPRAVRHPVPDRRRRVSSTLAGVVVDAKRGSCWSTATRCPRSTTSASSSRARWRSPPPRALHPTHNFAVVEYDPAAIAGDCVASVEPRRRLSRWGRRHLRRPAARRAPGASPQTAPLVAPSPLRAVNEGALPVTRRHVGG